jgi:hypothetical protein
MARIWSSSENKLKLVMLPVGILGITAGDHWQPLRQYMLSLPRDAKPRDEMLVAAVTYQTNPKLAETALAHAAAAGEKGAMFHALAAEAAFYDLRFDDSLVFGNIAMKEKPDQAWQLARLMNGIALQTFHWKLAIDLRHRFPNAWLPPANGTDSEEVVESMTDAFEGMPVDEMPNPVEAFSKLKYADHAADIEAMNVQYAYAPEYCTKELRKNHALKIAITDGKYVDLHIGPSAANVDFSCTARLRQGDDNHSGWDKLMHFGLAEEPTGDVPLLFYINVNLNGTICVGNRNTISTFGLNSAIQFNKPFSVRVAAVGNRCEVVINGIRIFYGPLLDDEGTRHLSPFMHFQGMSCNVSDIVYRTAGPGGH